MTAGDPEVITNQGSGTPQVAADLSRQIFVDIPMSLRGIDVKRVVASLAQQPTPLLLKMTDQGPLHPAAIRSGSRITLAWSMFLA
jgi:hypothetical protein